MIIPLSVHIHFMSFLRCTILHVDIVYVCLTCSCIYIMIPLCHVMPPHVICLVLSHLPMHLHYLYIVSCDISQLYLPIAYLFALIYVACMVKVLHNKCLCQINPKIVIKMKASRKAGQSWVPNTFPRTYISFGLSPRLVTLFMDSKLVPGPKNQVATPFLRPSP